MSLIFRKIFPRDCTLIWTNSCLRTSKWMSKRILKLLALLPWLSPQFRGIKLLIPTLELFSMSIFRNLLSKINSWCVLNVQTTLKKIWFSVLCSKKMKRNWVWQKVLFICKSKEFTVFKSNTSLENYTTTFLIS